MAENDARSKYKKAKDRVCRGAGELSDAQIIVILEDEIDQYRDRLNDLIARSAKAGQELRDTEKEKQEMRCYINELEERLDGDPITIEIRRAPKLSNIDIYFQEDNQ